MMSCAVTTTVKNTKFDDSRVRQDAHEHIQQDNDSPSCSNNPVDGLGNFFDIAGTNTGLNSGPTDGDNVTV